MRVVLAISGSMNVRQTQQLYSEFEGFTGEVGGNNGCCLVIGERSEIEDGGESKEMEGGFLIRRPAVRFLGVHSQSAAVIWYHIARL